MRENIIHKFKKLGNKYMYFYNTKKYVSNLNRVCHGTHALDFYQEHFKIQIEILVEGGFGHSEPI